MADHQVLPLVLRLDNEKNRKRVDPLLREFVSQMALWVKSSMSMMIQVGEFLYTFLIYHKMLPGPQQTLLVNVGPFRLALVDNTNIIGFTLSLEKVVFSGTSQKESSLWPRNVQCQLRDLQPQVAQLLMQVLAQVDHPVAFPLNRSRGVLPPRHSMLAVHERKKRLASASAAEADRVRDMIWEASFKPFEDNPYWDVLFQVESHLLSLVCDWWCGSVQALAEMGHYGHELLLLLSEKISEAGISAKLPRFLQDGELASMLTGIVFSDQEEDDDDTHRQAVRGIDRYGNMIEQDYDVLSGLKTTSSSNPQPTYYL